MTVNIALASDHAGFEAKEIIKRYLTEQGIEFEDYGTDSTASCDYPEYARAAAQAVSSGKCNRGVICCGSGIGVSIVANKVRGIRAALCHDSESARLSRQHNDSNVLCLAGRSAASDKLIDILTAWLGTEFEGGRHQTRVDKIEKPRSGESQAAWYSIH
jgi:ribose 5-phosphate isomerase B